MTGVGVLELDLERALAGAHLPTLLMSLVHLTGDPRWLAERYRPARPRGWSDPSDGGLPEDVQEEIRTAARDAFVAWRDGRVELAIPPGDRIVEMMGVCVGQAVADEYIEMVAEEIGLRDRDATWAQPHTAGVREDLRVLVIGAGFSGLGLAMKLERARIPYAIVEKNAEVGGVWLENDYPGAKVDSPSHLYQYSFEPAPDWPDYYSRRDAIRAYLNRCADRYDLRRHIRFSTEVRRAEWNAERLVWEVDVVDATGRAERLEAAVLVSSVGQLNRPKVPAVPGAETFRGTAMHTARWDREVPIAGRRVAVIGTGATSMQLVPAIAGTAGKVTVFQRSPQWAVPNPDLDRAVSDEARWLLANMPFYSGWYRFRLFWLWNDNIWPTLQIDPDWPHPERSINEANERARVFLTEHIERTLAERPDLIGKCVPDYPPYGKRMLMDAGWFETVRRDDVDLVTEPIERITPGGVLTTDGTEHPADVIAYATGFEAQKILWPMEIVGRDGVSVRDVWGDDDPRAHLGITVPGFPNLFCLYGPNTNLGHGGSVVFHSELQVRYVMGMLRGMLDRDLAAVEVRREVHDEYNARVDAAHERMIWSHRGMSTWYRNAAGRVVTNSPWRLVEYWRMTRAPDFAEYETISRTES